jgi:hypothetical protein
MTDPTIDYKKAYDMQAKRLARYPIQVRNIKRLRRQIVGLNRCIRSEKEYGEGMYQALKHLNDQFITTINNIKTPKPNNAYIIVTGVVCFVLGMLMGVK